MLIPPTVNLTPHEQELALSLVTDLDQPNLFASCKTGTDFKNLLAQLAEADATLAPGGLRDYVRRGRLLLEESRAGRNPLDGCGVSVPTGVELDPSTDAYAALEAVGEREVAGLCFVLVAGGLGERLGYPGIKIALPVETQTGVTYMELFAGYILEFQRLAREQSGDAYLRLPLAIMTSADTHSRTLTLLEEHNYYGMDPSQVTLMMQGKVPCFGASDGTLAVSSEAKLELKPHGHGDVHGLLLQTGLAQRWTKEGRKWLFFFQDTNSLAMRPLCACLGVSVQHGFAMNSFAVPRAPREASGGICRLAFADGRVRTVSVEYNLLGGLLEPQGGDVAGPSGDSPYPGNCNILLFDLPKYTDAIVRSHGVVPEFVNPKYTDEKKAAFKAPTRLECLMQDFALLLGEDAPVGFCLMPRWLTFSVVKNSVLEAAGKQRGGQPLDCALSGECEFFDANCRVLEIAAKQAGFACSGCSVKDTVSFLGLQHPMGPRVSLLPSFGLTIAAIARRIKGSILIAGGSRSSLVIGGHDTTLGPIELDGALEEVNGSREREATNVSNAGWALLAVPEGQAVTPDIAIRGFHVVRNHPGE